MDDLTIYTELSSEDKQSLIDGTVAIKTKIIVQPDAKHPEQLVLTEEDSIKTWDLVDERYVPDFGFIGQFTARTLTGELQNISDDFNIENREIQLLMGVVKLGTRFQYLASEDGNYIITESGERILVSDLGEDNTTWYSLGNFLITKPEDNEVTDNTKFESFDYATKFNNDFNPGYTSENYPTSFSDLIANGNSLTASDLASYVCEQTGVELGNNDFTNSNFIISTNQFTQGESCRDVMKAISQLAFGWCRIGWDNKCYIDEPQTLMVTSGEENVLTNDNYYSLTTQKETFGPVNRIVIGMSSVQGTETIIQDETSIAENGLTEITIMDNPILYTKELRDSLEESSRKLLGLTYSPLETETPGHPWLRGNELIDVRDMESNNRYTYPFNRTIVYTGHIKSKINSPAPTSQEKATQYSRTLYKTIRDIGITVDAQNGKINTINEKVQAAEDGLSALTNRVENEITDTYSKTQIQEIISGTAEDGTVVSSVKSTAGTFDMNGLTIEQTDKPNTKTNINADGMVIYNKKGGIDGDELLLVNSNGVVAKNVKVSTYLNIGKHSRIEDYTHTDYTEGTGVFWIGSDY